MNNQSLLPCPRIFYYNDDPSRPDHRYYDDAAENPKLQRYLWDECIAPFASFAIRDLGLEDVPIVWIFDAFDCGEMGGSAGRDDDEECFVITIRSLWELHGVGHLDNTVYHELRHVWQQVNGYLWHDDEHCYWNGKPHTTAREYLNRSYDSYHSYPWEQDARAYANRARRLFRAATGG